MRNPEKGKSWWWCEQDQEHATSDLARAETYTVTQGEKKGPDFK